MSAPPDKYPLLDAISSPADLRHLAVGKLPALAAELRSFLIQSVSTRGGHFAAGLGTVELTIALHYVYDTPRDRLVWDVGHQAYPHKVLTGRRAHRASVYSPWGVPQLARLTTKSASSASAAARAPRGARAAIAASRSSRARTREASSPAVLG